jgi:hypothetical protein
MNNNNFFDIFYARPSFASTIGSADADNHDSGGNCSEHAYFEIANFQKDMILQLSCF